MITLDYKKEKKKVLQLMGTLDRGGVESMILNLLRIGFKTDICLEIHDKGSLVDVLDLQVLIYLISIPAQLQTRVLCLKIVQVL